MIGGSETRLRDVRFQAIDRQTTMTEIGAHCRPSAFPFAIGRFWFDATFNAANLTDRVWSFADSLGFATPSQIPAASVQDRNL